MKLTSEYLGGLRDLSRSEISGLLNAYGGEIEEETDAYLMFSTKHPEKIVSRCTFSKRIGRVIEDSGEIDIGKFRTYALRERKTEGTPSLIEETAKRIKGRVNLKNPDVTFFIYNYEPPIVCELIYERRMRVLLDRRYENRPMSHPSSISPLLARGMINISGIKEGKVVLDPFAGTGTFLIEGFRMGIEAQGIDRSWKMVEGGNSNLRHFGFAETIRQGDFSDMTSAEDISALITDPPYGRGAKIFSQSRDSLYSRFFSIASGMKASKVLCLPSEDLLTLGREYLDLELVSKIRVHSSLTRYVAKSP